MALCIECEGELELADDVEVGEIVECPECGTEMEVVSVQPVKLAEAPKEEEDWGE